jgi:hypothetical protein
MIRFLKTKQGNDAINQFVVTLNNGDNYFISYSSVIAKISNGVVMLDAYYWDFSVATKFYLAQFLGYGVAEIRKRIKNNEIKLVNLN